jgi:hypothetical protein
MTIEDIDTADLARVVADLVKQGLTFRATPGRIPHTWNITLTGGY